MIVSTLMLAMALVLLVPVRMSDAPQSLGVVVFTAAALVAVACALHLSAAIAAIPGIGRSSTILGSIGAWLVVGGGTAWAISRAPGIELVVLLMTVPLATGMAGVVLAEPGRRWHGVPFLGLAIGLALLLLPVWLSRQAT